jgi:hypothetical protein
MSAINIRLICLIRCEFTSREYSYLPFQSNHLMLSVKPKKQNLTTDYFD